MDAEKKLLKELGSGAKLEQLYTNGHKINYLVAGSGDPLILLHGANVGWGQWYNNISELSKYFKIYALDLPGAGKSSRIDYKTAKLENDFVETIVKFIEQKNLNNISLIGHSLGAWVALKIALGNKEKIKKIVLVSPVGFSKKNQPRNFLVGFWSIAKFLSKTILRPTKKTIRSFIESGFSDRSKLTEKFLEYYFENIQHDPKLHPLLLINRITGPFSIRPEFILLDKLKQIEIPSLVLIGVYDNLVGPTTEHLEAFKLIPNSQTQIFKSSGHVPFIEENQEFNNSVLKFLNS